MLRTSFWPAKLLHLQQHDPKLFAEIELWMSPAEWIQIQLAGSASCALGMATGTGLFNPSTLDWDDSLLAHCKIQRRQLLPLSDNPTPIQSTLAKDFPELYDVPWFPGIGDGAASNLGSGCTAPGLAAINVGTSAAIRVLCKGKAAQAPFGLFCYRVDAERYLIGGAVSNAGNLRAWGIKELQLPDPETIEAALSSRQSPSHSLTVLPFWSPERAPSWNEDTKGCILGITHATTSVDILQALMESTYHRLAQISDLLIKQTNNVPKFFVSGGIQNSPAALQRLTNVLGRPLHANPEPEASIRGAAIFAMEKLGMHITPLHESLPLSPNPSAARQYIEAREKQILLEQILQQHWQ